MSLWFQMVLAISACPALPAVAGSGEFPKRVLQHFKGEGGAEGVKVMLRV